ncbi:hypothetical protein D3C87_2115030 [compost metagenome]
MVRIAVDGDLLGFQDPLILAEDARHPLAQFMSTTLLRGLVVAGKGPEIVAGLVGLGRDGVEHETVDALAAVALGGA